jgi:hypothetical protein
MPDAAREFLFTPSSSEAVRRKPIAAMFDPSSTDDEEHRRALHCVGDLGPRVEAVDRRGVVDAQAIGAAVSGVGGDHAVADGLGWDTPVHAAPVEVHEEVSRLSSSFDWARSS